MTSRILTYFAGSMLLGGVVGTGHGAFIGFHELLLDLMNQRIVSPHNLTWPFYLIEYIGAPAAKHGLYGALAGPIWPAFVWDLYRRKTECTPVNRWKKSVDKLATSIMK